MAILAEPEKHKRKHATGKVFSYELAAVAEPSSAHSVWKSRRILGLSYKMHDACTTQANQTE